MEPGKATSASLFKEASEAYRRKEYQAALDACEHLAQRQQHPKSLAAIYNLKALSLAGLGNIIDALDGIGQALELSAGEARLHLHAARLLARLGRNAPALAHLQSAASLDPANPDPDYLAARIYQSIGQPGSALMSAKASVNKDAGNLEGWMLLAELSAEQGNDEDVLPYLRPALEASPIVARAWAWLSEMEARLHSGLPLEDKLMQARDEAGSDEDYVTAVFALAYQKRQAGLHAEAFSLYKEGNERVDAVQPFDIDAWEARVADVIAASAPPPVTAHGRGGSGSCMDPDLLFIVGMPRSGTSLCEQIVCAHPSVHGAGELPTMEYIEKCLRQRGIDPYGPDTTGWMAEMQNIYRESLPLLNEEKTWVIDKTPRNFERLGLILRLFPEARVLWMLRHPLDTVLSCFFQDFVSSQGFSRRLDHAARVYLGHLNLLRHWKQYWGDAIRVVEYSTMVNDLAASVKGMADFLGLDFHPAMLEPHMNPRLVRTASAAQVRQPVFTTSIDHWKHYADELADLMPLMRSLGLIDADARMAFSV